MIKHNQYQMIALCGNFQLFLYIHISYIYYVIVRKRTMNI